MSRPSPPACRTRNWQAHTEALKRRGSLTIWFDPELSWDAALSGRGRHPVVPDDEGGRASRKGSGDRFPDDWMHCVKLLGQRLMARDFDRQVAEIRLRTAVLNGCTALGIAVTEAVRQVLLGKREISTSEALCNRALRHAQVSLAQEIEEKRNGPRRMAPT